MISHYWHTLPGPVWFSAVKIYAEQVARAQDGALFVEVGAWKGRSTSFMAVEIANSNKAIQFYTVDHWRGSEEGDHEVDEDFRAGRLYETFLANIAPVRDYVHAIRADSVTAACQFANSSVDFLYLDAGHTYEAVIRDLEAWWPKLKPGGLLAGDDWDFPDEKSDVFEVRKAVTEFFTGLELPICIKPGAPYEHWRQWLVGKPTGSSHRISADP